MAQYRLNYHRHQLNKMESLIAESNEHTFLKAKNLNLLLPVLPSLLKALKRELPLPQRILLNTVQELFRNLLKQQKLIKVSKLQKIITKVFVYHSIKLTVTVGFCSDLAFTTQ